MLSQTSRLSKLDWQSSIMAVTLPMAPSLTKVIGWAQKNLSVSTSRQSRFFDRKAAKRVSSSKPKG